MTYEEFEKQIDRLVDVYSDKHYPPDRIKLFWKRFGWVHPTIFSSAMDEMIADCPHAPLFNRIREAISAARKNHPELDCDPYKPIRERIYEKIKSPDPCRKCAGWGMLLAYRKHRNLETTTLICNCSAGTLAKQLPEYRSDRIVADHDYFYLIFEFDINRHEKFDLYRGLEFPNVQAAMDVLSEIYYGKEIHMEPCYWRPKELCGKEQLDRATAH